MTLASSKPSHPTVHLPFIQIQREGEVPLFQQIYRQLTQAILSGQLRSGDALPSTRQLSSALGVSRNTVINAYDTLLAEGYIEGTVGSGSYVSRQLPEDLTELPSQPVVSSSTLNKPKAKSSPHNAPMPLPDHMQSLLNSPLVVYTDRGGEPVPFRSGIPALDAFPSRLWLKLVNKHWKSPEHAMLNYGRTAGYTPLCEAIAHYLNSSRGVQCDADQVIIVSGSQQGLDLTSRVLLTPNDTVWMENPGYLGARAAFQSAKAHLIGVPLDEEGLDLTWATTHSAPAKVAFVTPSHQYPLGITMSLRRRLALLDWANEHDSWIIEDDYDSEYRYAGRPLSSLQGLDRHDRVIYIGTFSKTMYPSLRLGYLVVPRSLIPAFITAKAQADQHSPLVDQAVLTDFINEGHFGRHLRRMRSLYAHRQSVLLSAVQKQFAKTPDRLTIQANQAGLHVVGVLPESTYAHLVGSTLAKDTPIDQVILASVKAAGISTLPLSLYYLHNQSSYPAIKNPLCGFLLGYSGYSDTQIQHGVATLQRVLKSL